MQTAALTRVGRLAALDRMTEPQGVDVLVVGGGITGAGIALDAAARGLTTAVVEAQDWASGTSSRSSRLVHGGLRYLQMLDFKLVHEALTERDLLLSTIAPHLVRPVPFLYPLSHRVWERAYVACGIGLYDALAHTPGRRRALPIQRHLTRAGVARTFPDLRPEVAVGAVRYWDAQADDARLVLTLIRTAVSHGALAASRTQLVGVTRDRDGAVDGADLVDLLTGRHLHVATRRVIAATGVWTEETESLAGPGGLRVLASKGVHLVVPRGRIRGRTGIISQTEKSVLFVIPWDTYWLIGTTDTPWDGDPVHPVATAQDVDYLLEHANAILSSDLTRADVLATYAGLRPLLQPGTKTGTPSAKVSREHTVASPVPGLTVIAGGKLTTYRVMARDAVDFALGRAEARARPCITETVPLVGAEGLSEVLGRRTAIARRYGWDTARVEHLIRRYGSLIEDLLAMVEVDPSLGEPLTGAPDYLRAEAVYAAEAEGALHLEDVLAMRLRLAHERPDRGTEAAEEVARLIAPTLGWSNRRVREEVAAWTERVQAQRAAEQAPDDAAALTARHSAGDPTPMIDTLQLI